MTPDEAKVILQEFIVSQDMSGFNLTFVDVKKSSILGCACCTMMYSGE